MNKIIVSELVVLAVLLIVAFCLVGALSEDSPAQTVAGPGPQIITPEETEEPLGNVTGKVPSEDDPEPTWMIFPENRELTAQQYFVFDVQAEEFLTISGNETDQIFPASVTKLFTCYVALQYLDSDQVITVGDELDMVAPGSSVADLRKGDQLTVSQLVEAMLLPSGNDAAHVLAANAGKTMEGGGNAEACVSAFMREMNRLAKEVGMAGTHFANPDGIHRDNHYMTFRDLATLGVLSVANETIMKNAVIASDTVTFLQRGAAVGEDVSDETVQWKNTNAIIHEESPYYCPYATGLKTGQTPRAGSCLLSSFAYEGRQYIIGVFGCPDPDSRFEDTLQLFNETIGIL